VLDSSGGSVNDAIAVGRRFRGLGMHHKGGGTSGGPRRRTVPLAPRSTVIISLRRPGGGAGLRAAGVRVPFAPGTVRIARVCDVH
jgi:hypothetical protein